MMYLIAFSDAIRPFIWVFVTAGLLLVVPGFFAVAALMWVLFPVKTDSQGDEE